ncbi:kelch domain-containing protein [Anaeramoeba ignava]|uniref:Kelch domain-containing protein n=1 Tax=Anaeramoeba ignava TaxID=1746090 RepID=A0A9Q0RFS6_ANAIG|nr:kelch domain-containing protein [Anaeramoeba ignava]
MDNFSCFHSSVGWQRIDSSSGLSPIPVTKCGIVTLGNYMYIFGGSPEINDSESNQFFAFDLITKEWIEINAEGECPTPRCAHAMCGFEDKIWLFGGSGTSNYLNDFYEYDVEQNKWKKIQTQKHPKARYSHSLNYCQGRLIVFGGVPEEGERLNDTWIFDLKSQNWNKLKISSEIPIGRSSHTSIIFENKLIIFGGYGADSRRHQDLWELNIKTDQWKQIQIANDFNSKEEKMRFLRKFRFQLFSDYYDTENKKPFYDCHIPLEMSGAVAMIYQERYLVIFGGVSSLIGTHNYTFIFDFETNKWMNYDKLLRDFSRYHSEIDSPVKDQQKVDQNIQKPPPRFGHVGVQHDVNQLVVFGGDHYQNDVWILVLEPNIVLDLRLFLQSKQFCDF